MIGVGTILRPVKSLGREREGNVRKLLFSAICCMVGCQPISAMPVRLPNGNVGAVVKCAHKSDCYMQSSRVCGATYSVLQANDIVANDFTSSNMSVEYIIQCESFKENSHVQQ